MVLGEIDVLDELLGDRAATLVEAQMQQVVESGLAGAQQIEASVLIEGAIFDGDGRLLHAGRHLGQGHDVLPLRPLVDLGEQNGSGAVVDAGRERQAGRAEIRGGGESGPHVQHTGEYDEEEGEKDGRGYRPESDATWPPQYHCPATPRAVPAIRPRRRATVGAERASFIDGLHYSERLNKLPPNVPRGGRSQSTRAPSPPRRWASAQCWASSPGWPGLSKVSTAEAGTTTR